MKVQEAEDHDQDRNRAFGAVGAFSVQGSCQSDSFAARMILYASCLFGFLDDEPLTTEAWERKMARGTRSPIR